MISMEQIRCRCLDVLAIEIAILVIIQWLLLKPLSMIAIEIMEGDDRARLCRWFTRRTIAIYNTELTWSIPTEDTVDMTKK